MTSWKTRWFEDSGYPRYLGRSQVQWFKGLCQDVDEIAEKAEAQLMMSPFPTEYPGSTRRVLDLEARLALATEELNAYRTGTIGSGEREDAIRRDAQYSLRKQLAAALEAEGLRAAECHEALAERDAALARAERAETSLDDISALASPSIPPYAAQLTSLERQLDAALARAEKAETDARNGFNGARETISSLKAQLAAAEAGIDDYLKRAAHPNTLIKAYRTKYPKETG